MLAIMFAKPHIDLPRPHPTSGHSEVRPQCPLMTRCAWLPKSDITEIHRLLLVPPQGSIDRLSAFSPVLERAKIVNFMIAHLFEHLAA